MKKLSIEVKTVYAIEFDFADFCNAFIMASEDGIIGYPEAFKGADLCNTTFGNIRDAWICMAESFNNTDTLRFIAHRYLGFCGVDNYGFQRNKDDKKVWRMTVYNEGSDI